MKNIEKSECLAKRDTFYPAFLHTKRLGESFKNSLTRRIHKPQPQPEHLGASEAGVISEKCIFKQSLPTIELQCQIAREKLRALLSPGYYMLVKLF